MQRSLSLLLVVGLGFSFGCGDASGDPTESSLPPDPEFGLETQGPADSNTIQPGTEEARAVLALANTPIANQSEGNAFVQLIDSRLHALAAKNIGKYRAGADGNFGTDDDRQFEDLESLDGVRWVGHVALTQLYDLALDQGLGPANPINCSERYDARGGTFRISSYENLLDIQQSGCNTIDGDLIIDFTAGDYVPPVARRLHQLENIREIQGDTRIRVQGDYLEAVELTGLETAQGLNLSVARTGENVESFSMSFPKLETATQIASQFIPGLDLKSLKSVQEIEVIRGASIDLSALESATRLEFEMSPGEVRLNSLKNVEFFHFNGWTASGDYQFAAPELESVSDRILLETNNGGLALSFPKLANANRMYVSNSHLEQFSAPMLREVGLLEFTNVAEPLVGFTAIEFVSELRFQDVSFPSTGHHRGPDSLKKVSTLEIKEDDRRRHVSYPIEGYSALEHAGTIRISADCGELTGFDSLVTAGSLHFSGECALRGFPRLEMLHDNLSYTGTYLGLDELTAVGARAMLTIDDADENLEKLEIIGENLYMYRFSGAYQGFDSLAVVEGDFKLVGRGTSITGFNRLDGVGGNIHVNRRVPVEDVDRVVDQLEQFSGEVYLVSPR